MLMYGIILMLYMFFFFKPKTAYEMRISDWSSDVCSSDLPRVGQGHPRFRRAVPLAVIPVDRHLHHAVARLRGRCAGHLSVRPAGIDRRGEGWMGRHIGRPARQQAPPLQLRGTDAPPARA